MKKLNCIHIDTCLPDYWPGCHVAHVQVPVDRRTTFKDVRELIRGELQQGAVMGSDRTAVLLGADMVDPDLEIEADRLTRAAYAAVNRDVKPARKGARLAFPELEDDPSVYAFFVFAESAGGR